MYLVVLDCEVQSLPFARSWGLQDGKAPAGNLSDLSFPSHTHENNLIGAWRENRRKRARRCFVAVGQIWPFGRVAKLLLSSGIVRHRARLVTLIPMDGQESHVTHFPETLGKNERMYLAFHGHLE